VSVFGRRLGRALARNHAETKIADRDPRLRGRTYAIPFEQVWQAARALASGGLRGCRLIESDDYEGIISAEWKALFSRSISDVLIRITLDYNAQTRVDVQSRSRRKAGDLGRNARLIGRFLRKLDYRLTHPPKPKR
jgi:hypothetical protein